MHNTHFHNHVCFHMAIFLWPKTNELCKRPEVDCQWCRMSFVFEDIVALRSIVWPSFLLRKSCVQLDEKYIYLLDFRGHGSKSPSM